MNDRTGFRCGYTRGIANHEDAFETFRRQRALVRRNRVQFVAHFAARDAWVGNRNGRAICIRQVDAGSCNGCELEIHALNNLHYNLEGLGIKFVAIPRHAELLLVTGPVSVNMA